jgi:hypothetical protein
MQLRVILFLSIVCFNIEASERFPDIVVGEIPKKVKKEKIEKLEPINSDLTLIELENKLENFSNLNKTDKARLILLIHEIRGKYDSSYIKLKSLSNKKGYLWYQMKDLYLTEKLGLEEEKANILKKLSERIFLMPLMVKELKFCTKVNGFGQYKEIKKQILGRNKQTIIYVEIDGVFQKKSKDGNYKSGFKTYFNVEDESGRIVYQQSEKEPFSYITQSLKRDYYVWLRWTPNLVSGQYTLNFVLEDTNNGSKIKTNHSFSVF